MIRKLTLLPLVFLMFSACDVIPIIDPPAKVNRVIDGQTVDITLESGQRIKARLAGVRVPGLQGKIDETAYSLKGTSGENQKQLRRTAAHAAGWMLQQLETGDAVRVAFLSENGQAARDRDGYPLIFLYERLEDASGVEGPAERQINRILIQKGYGIAVEDDRLTETTRASYRAAQKEARAANRGIWESSEATK